MAAVVPAAVAVSVTVVLVATIDADVAAVVANKQVLMWLLH